MRRRFRCRAAPVSLFSFQDIITSISGIMIFVTLLMAVEVAARLGALPSNQPPDSPEARAGQAAALRREVAALRAALAAKPPGDWDSLAAAQASVRDDRRRRQAGDALQRARTALAAADARLAEEQADAAGAAARRAETRAAIRELESKLRERGEITLIPEAPDSRRPVLLECSGRRVRAGALGAGEPPREFTADRAGLAALTAHVESQDKSAVAVVAMIKPSGAGYAMKLVNRLREQGYAVGYDALEEEKNVRFQPGPAREDRP